MVEDLIDSISKERRRVYSKILFSKRVVLTVLLVYPLAFFLSLKFHSTFPLLIGAFVFLALMIIYRRFDKENRDSIRYVGREILHEFMREKVTSREKFDLLMRLFEREAADALRTDIVAGGLIGVLLLSIWNGLVNRVFQLSAEDQLANTLLAMFGIALSLWGIGISIQSTKDLFQRRYLRIRMISKWAEEFFLFFR